MSKAKTVLVRNHRKRNYNGINYMQITEIPEHYLTQYLSAWFMLFPGEEQSKKAKVPLTPHKKEYDVKEAKAYLEEHNIKFAKNMKDENIIKRALENWWGEKTQSPKIDDTDLSLLDEDDFDLNSIGELD